MAATAFTRSLQRFTFAGISLFPPDSLQLGKFPYAANLRAYQENALQVRPGLITLGTVAGGSVSTIYRLNDPSSYATVAARRLLGSTNGTLYSGDALGVVYGVSKTGFSSNPLQILSANPSQSPRPFAYVADSAQMVKINSDGTVYNVGIAQPLTPPAVALNPPGLTVIDEAILNAGWSAAGMVAGALAGPVVRVNTTIAAILYDSGATGYASIVATSMANIGAGCRVALGGAETVIVERVALAIANTTIGSIVYDAGTSGACSIQPAASLGTGQLISPPIEAYENRNPWAYGLGPNIGVPPQTSLANPAPTPTISQVDFPLDCIVTLGGASENVRVLAVSLGADGIQGFRCVTANTHAAGDAITGLASFRAYLTTNRSPGDSIVANALQNVLTPPGTGPQPITGGIKKTANVNAALVGGRATLADDLVHLTIKVDRLDYVVSIRIYLDVDAATNDYTQNYYVFEWRANDIAAAIQGINTAQVQTFITTSASVVANQQLSPTASYVIRNGVVVASTNPAQPATPPVSAQLTVGNNQWIELTARVGDLDRVGTDPTRSLANVAAFEILINAVTPQALTVNYNAFYLHGGYGPSVGFGDPYVWRYRYRSSALGIVSNVSPASRASLRPQRQRCLLTPTASGDPQVDTIDWFRLGGGLPVWTYAGTGPNTTAIYNDDVADTNIDGGATPPFDDFQLWPTLDLPRVGTCMVAASSLLWLTGATFNVNWAPGAVVLVNGKGCTIQQVMSTTVLILNENAGSSASTAFNIQDAEILGQPLPAFWGPFAVPGGGTTYFGCGDPNNPGTLYWTKSNNPDVTSDAYSLIVTSGSEVLQCGWIWDERAFVASSEQVYEIFPDYARPGQFIAVATPCGRGPWTRWSWATAPEGTYFLDKAGIHLTSGGSVARSITEPDLTALFPHDASLGLALSTTKVLPPNYLNPTRLRLSYLDKFLYFDYETLGSVGQSLVFDTTIPRWYLDTYALDTGLITRLWEPGAMVGDAIVSGNTGLFLVGGTSDNAQPIAWELWTPWWDGGDLRLVKQFGDIILDADPQGGGITANLVVNDAASTFGPEVMGAGVVGRTLLPPFDISGFTTILARNFGLRLTGSTIGAPPVLYAWEPSVVPKVEDTAARPTDWDDLGYVGAKWVQGVVIRANTYNAKKIVQVWGDLIPQIELVLQHNGEQEVAYPNGQEMPVINLALPGWTPFIAELVRLIPNDLLPWQLYGMRWVYEPAPELAVTWTAQSTSLDAPGYVQVRDLVLAHMSTADLALTLKYDNGVFGPIVVPNSGGIYKRTYVPLPALKGLSVQPSVTSVAPFRVFKRDCSWRVQPWGQASGYQIQLLFGGPSRADGAGI